MKKVLCLVISLMILVSFLFPVSVVAADTSNSTFSLDNTSVVDDLKSYVIDLDTRFPLDPSDEGMYLITMMEQGYDELSGIDSGNFGLYLYVYNPSGKSLFGEVDKVQFATRWTRDNSGVIKALDYSKYALIKIDSDDNNTLIKFKVYSPNKKIMLRDGNTRRYDVSGFEVQTEELGNIKDYTVGTTFTYSGYAKGLSSESRDHSTLACVRDQLTTISVDVHQVSYLACNSSLGVGYSNQVNSVYFSLPKEIEKKYGDLYSIKYEYNHYYTNPFIVVDNSNSYNIFKNYVGKRIQDPNSFGYEIVNGVYSDMYGQKLYDYNFSFGRKNKNVTFMAKPAQTYLYDDAIVPSYLTLLFLKENYGSDWEYGDILVSSDELLRSLKNYNASYISGDVLGYSADLFDFNKSDKYCVQTKNVKDSFNLEGYADGEGKNLLLRWLNYGFNTKEDLEGIKDVKYIEKISSTDIINADDFSRKYLIDDKYKADLVKYCVSSELQNNVYLLRYDYRPDYYSLQCEINEVTSDIAGYNVHEQIGNALMSQGSVYLNFDIIQFSFMDNGNETIIPVVSDPSNGVFDLTVTDPDRDMNDLIRDIFNKKGNDDPEFNLLLIGVLLIIATIVIVAVFVICCIYVPGFATGVLNLLKQLLDVSLTWLAALWEKIKIGFINWFKSLKTKFEDFKKNRRSKKDSDNKASKKGKGKSSSDKHYRPKKRNVYSNNKKSVSYKRKNYQTKKKYYKGKR